MTTRVVGVFPGRERGGRRRLFDALELAFPVRFQEREAGDFDGLDAALFIGAPLPNGSPPCPWLSFERVGPEEASATAPAAARTARVQLTTDPLLDSRLAGRALTDLEAGSAIPLRAVRSERVLGAVPAGPLWLARPGRRGPGGYRASTAPPELGSEEPLRSRLRAGSFVALLPLVHLLREVCRERAWSQPAPRAGFIIDDPNLHSLRYGHIDYRRLAEHAARSGYHVVLASIPLDYAYVHPPARDLFAERASQVSLAIHGNDHAGSELAAVRSEKDALALGAQALRRSERLERTSGLAVARVMCPPHEECAPLMLQAMFRLGFDALVKEPLGKVGREGPNPESVLAGWEPATLLAGLPVVPRYPLGGHDDDLVFQAYLNLPFLLFGHHFDLAGGPDVLDAEAERVNRVARCEWVSLADLCRSNAVQWREGADLVVRPYARRVSVPVDPEATRLIVETPTSDPPAELLVSAGSASAGLRSGGRVSLPMPAAASIEIEMGCPDGIAPEAVREPRRRLWPLARRALTEARDRLSGMRRPPYPSRSGRSSY